VRPDRVQDRPGAEQDALGVRRNHLVEPGSRPEAFIALDKTAARGHQQQQVGYQLGSML
jgi:hypothetical protein